MKKMNLLVLLTLSVFLVYSLLVSSVPLLFVGVVLLIVAFAFASSGFDQDDAGIPKPVLVTLFHDMNDVERRVPAAWQGRKSSTTPRLTTAVAAMTAKATGAAASMVPPRRRDQLFA